MVDAKKGDTVKIHFTGKLEDGSSFGSSADREPLEFTIGEAQVIPGFEQAVVGMNEGETKTVTIEAEHAFGEHREDMMVEIERERLPTDNEIEVLLEKHKAMITKKRRIVKVKFCSVCGRIHCNFRPVSFDVEVDD